MIPLQGMLQEEFGIKSSIFESGEQAVKAFQMRLQAKCCNRAYKLVFTDIAMPEIDGYEVAKLI